MELYQPNDLKQPESSLKKFLTETINPGQE